MNANQPLINIFGDVIVINELAANQPLIINFGGFIVNNELAV